MLARFPLEHSAVAHHLEPDARQPPRIFECGSVSGTTRLGGAAETGPGQIHGGSISRCTIGRV